MKKTISIILLLSISIFSLSSCAFRDDIASITEKWVPEQDNNVAILSDVGNQIILNGNKHDINPTINQQFNKNFFVTSDYQVVCIFGDNIYGVDRIMVDGSFGDGWFLYRINFLTGELKILYSTETHENPGSNYPIAYVKNAVIYINDDVRTITYDIGNQLLNELSNAEFEEPNVVLIGHCIAPGQKYSYEGENETSIILKRNEDNELRYISFDYIADRHEYFNQIREYGKKIKYSQYQHLPQEFFLYNEVSIIDNMIYISLNICDADGDATNVVFRYDFEKDEFHYIYHVYGGDLRYSKVVQVYE